LFLGSSDDRDPFPNHHLRKLATASTSCKHIRDLFLDQETRKDVEKALFDTKSASYQQEEEIKLQF
jgi:hypothetical protein